MTPLEEGCAEIATLCFAVVAVVAIGAMLLTGEARPVFRQANRQPPKYYKSLGGYVRR